MADEIKHNASTDPGPPPDPDEGNPNAPPVAANPTPVEEIVADEPLQLDIGPIDLTERQGRLSAVLDNLGDLGATVQGQVAGFVEDFKNPFAGGKKIDAIAKLKISAIALLAVLFCVVIYYWGGKWNIFFQDHNVYSLTDKAAQIYELNPEDAPVEFEHDLLVPQHIVLLEKVVVNLKRSPKSGDNPMAAFNIYLHATNQETSIEIKDRERDLQDFVQRLTEDFSYDQLLTESGKRKWKIALKSELNMVLTQGKIKDVYFNTLLIKP